MEPLSAFFNKFRKLVPPERNIKEATLVAIKKEIGVTIASKQVRVTRDTVVIRAPSVIKSEIKLHEEELLEKINSALKGSGQRIRMLL